MTTEAEGDPVRICVVADDFGLHPFIDEAILALAGSHALQAIGCLVGGRSWLTAARSLRVINRTQLDRGLHFDLTERPLTTVPQALPGLIARAMLRLIDPLWVRNEVRAQLNAFEAELGHGPDFVDGHQHVHQLPGVREAIVDELDDRYPASRRPWLRSTLPAIQAPGLRGLSARHGRKAWVVAALGGRAATALARRRGYATNSGFVGVYGFDRDTESYRSLLGRWLAEARDGSLLMCHPALDRVPGDAIAPARTAEYAVLSDGSLASMLDQAGLVASPMTAIIRRPDMSPMPGHAGTVQAGSAQIR